MKKVFLFLIFSNLLFAHEEIQDTRATMWEFLQLPDPVTVVYAASIISGIAIIISLMASYQLPAWKKTLFMLIAAPVAIATMYMAVTTVYLNTISETKGPVHWHADFEIWACEEKQNLIDPTAWDNKVGSPILHEHNDDRIHVEGVLLKKEDARLGRFFAEIGARFDGTIMTLPTNDGLHTWKNGEMCGKRNAQWNVFVNGVKIEEPEHYILSPYPNVPPGDCIILEFGEKKQKTDKQCESHRIAIEKGEKVGS